MGLKGFIEIDINKLKKADWNYKEDNDKLLEKLKANIKNNGLVINLIVRELKDGSFEVVNGNHRLEACKQLNIKKVNVFNLGEIDELTAKRIAIETNETNFETNTEALSGVLKELFDAFGKTDLSNTFPYEDFELDAFVGLESFNFEDADLIEIPSKSKKGEDSSGIICPHCGGLN